MIFNLRNIFVRNDRIKLGNFGIEQLVKTKVNNFKKNIGESSNQACYFSPEVIETKKFTAKCDVW